MSAAAPRRLLCMDVGGGSGAALVRVPPHGAAEALAEAGRLLSAGRSVVVALDPHTSPDVETVGALARLVLAARRGGAVLVVRAPDAALTELAELMGLADVLTLRGELKLRGDPPAAGATSGQPQR